MGNIESLRGMEPAEIIDRARTMLKENRIQKVVLLVTDNDDKDWIAWSCTDMNYMYTSGGIIQKVAMDIILEQEE